MARLVCLRHKSECPNETLFASLSHARRVLDAWRADYSGVRPHPALANRTPESPSPEHLLRPEVTAIGVAMARSSSGRPYWTLVLGAELK